MLCPEKNLKWIKHKGKALGVWFCTNPKETLEANFADKLAKISNCLACWELRRLALLGKITVLMSLIVSQLVYILSPLPTNQKVLEELNSRLFKFLWSDKGDKIKQNIMISDYSEGGLKMIDLISFKNPLGLKNSLTQKITENGSIYLNCNYIDMGARPFSEAT